jgi:hypothetical protein
LSTSQPRFDTVVTTLIAVYSSGDEALVRQSRVKIVRDNVLFEFGLFTGRIGKGRTFRLSAKGTSDTHIPVDLAGIVHLTSARSVASTASRPRPFYWHAAAIRRSPVLSHWLKPNVRPRSSTTCGKIPIN